MRSRGARRRWALLARSLPAVRREPGAGPGARPRRLGGGRGGAARRLRARLRILVPADAFVFVARDRMTSTGGVRIYESPPLQRGRRYAYEISVIHEGREVAREVGFEPGRTVEVDFRVDFERLERESR